MNDKDYDEKYIKLLGSKNINPDFDSLTRYYIMEGYFGNTGDDDEIICDDKIICCCPDVKTAQEIVDLLNCKNQKDKGIHHYYFRKKSKQYWPYLDDPEGYVSIRTNKHYEVSEEIVQKYLVP